MKSYLLHLGVFLIFLISTSLGACTLPTPHRPDLQVHIYEPGGGAIVPEDLDTPVNVEVFRGTDVNRMTLYANGIDMGDFPAWPTNPDGYIGSGISWTPTEPGEYLLQVAAFLSTGGLDISDPLRVCVLDISLFSGGFNDGFLDSFGYTGPCEIPAPDPSAPPGLPVSLTAAVTPAALGYSTAGCPGPNVPISFQAVVDDPSDRVAFVSVRVEVDSDVVWIDLNWTSSLPTGEKVFTGSYDEWRRELPGDVTPIYTFHWTAKAYARDGSLLAMDGPHDLLAAPCTPVVIPPPMPLIIAPTNTPASDADCPPGTYFAPVTNQCIQIQIRPTKQGGHEGAGGNDCSSYGNASSCTTNGCSWDKPTNSCH